MNFIRKITRQTLLLFTFCFLVVSIDGLAQVSSGIDPNNLSNVRIDDLSDDQIRLIIKESANNGISIEDGVQIAIKRGLPNSEAQKLKDRISKMRAASGTTLNNTQGSIMPSTENPTVKTIELQNKTEEQLAEVNTGQINNPDDPSGLNATIIYGQEYFRNGDIKVFDKSVDAKAPKNYIIGVDDEIGVSVFGYSFYNEVLKVDSRGAINPSQMGPIFVKGLTYERAKALIKAKMGQYFDLSNNKIEITLAYSRTITVNIIGEVMRPGSYKFPAVNTAFNALIMAGGTTNIGSMREIEIRRGGKTIKKLDVYAFLTNPDSQQEFYLEENDYIVVKTSSKTVRVSGEVNRVGVYELLPQENLIALIKYAGGLTASAYTERVQIKRKSAKELKIIDVNLDSLIKIKKDLLLQVGDKIEIKTQVEFIINKLTVLGAVNYPGDYNFKKASRISDVINEAGGLRQDANVENAYLVRTLEDQTKKYFRINLKDIVNNVQSDQNLELKPLDVLTIYSNREFTENTTVLLHGAVKQPANYTYVQGMTLGDLLLNAGGLKLEAENLRIEIARLTYFSKNYVDGDENRVIIERVQLDSNNEFLNSTDAKILLNPYDQVYVRSVPNLDYNQNVTILGEVKYPGVYALTSRDERISDVIKRSGGLTAYAFTEAATFYRPSLPGGYIVLKLNDAIKKRTNKYNYALKSGDVINIPTVTDYVTIQGQSLEYLSISNLPQANVPYVGTRRAKYYINQFANGFSKDSWKRKTYVIQPNTKVNRTHNFILFKVYPKVTKGSAIYVVTKNKRERKIKNEGDEFNVNKFIESSMVKLTGLATLFILLRQLGN